MKLLVFAHTPPPHHGQSYMVKLMLEGLGGDWRKLPHVRKRPQNGEGGPSEPSRLPGADAMPDTFSGVQCYHVDGRFSADIGDIGSLRLSKVLLIFRYCAEAIWCRFYYGVRTFYFVPSPPKWPALCRDWLVMLLCRPFFRNFIHHWHATGTTDWLERDGNAVSRWLTQRLLGRPVLGIALATENLRDSLWLHAKQVAVVPNGIEDPFPDFEKAVLPERMARLNARRSLIRGEKDGTQSPSEATEEQHVFRLLYLGVCHREKGVFETLDGVAIAQRRLREQGHPLTLHLTVAGPFSSAADRAQFMTRIASSDLKGLAHYDGVADGTRKIQLLRESDCLCFPTYCDSFGLVVLEAMAAGLNVIATRWRALPEILPPEYPGGFIPIKNAEAIADIIPQLFEHDGTPLRALFLERFTEIKHIERLRAALVTAETR